MPKVEAIVPVAAVAAMFVDALQTDHDPAERAEPHGAKRKFGGREFRVGTCTGRSDKPITARGLDIEVADDHQTENDNEIVDKDAKPAAAGMRCFAH